LLVNKPSAMVSSAMLRAVASMSLRPTAGAMAPLSSMNGNSLVPSQQHRFITKARKKREERKAKWAELAKQGIFPPKPPKYLDPKNTPVIGAISREDRDRVAKEAEERASQEMKERMDQVKNKEPLQRFHFEGVKMSDRVQKLFDLTNGSQSEVVKAQKQRGMELFQMREGDTGSSAVQVIALTTRIQQKQTHLRTHKKDNSSKRGLDALYVRRRKVLDYMERKDFESYRKVVKTLGLVR